MASGQCSIKGNQRSELRRLEVLLYIIMYTYDFITDRTKLASYLGVSACYVPNSRVVNDIDNKELT